MYKKLFLIASVSILTILPIRAQNPVTEDTLEAVTKRILSVESCAVIFTINQQRYVDSKGEVYPGFKKIALYARGPLNITDTEDSTLRVYEEFLAFNGVKAPNNQSTHHIAFSNGIKTYSWDSRSRDFQEEPRFNFMKIYTPPHYVNWLENVLVYPLYQFLEMKECNVLARENQTQQIAGDQSIELLTEFGPGGRLKHRIEFTPSLGIKRIEQLTEPNSEIVVDQYKDVNGIQIPARGRIVYKTHSVKMNLLSAKINDEVPKQFLNTVEIPIPQNEGSKVAPGFTFDPTYFDKFFDLNIENALAQLSKL